jgi:hypothetical protein
MTGSIPFGLTPREFLFVLIIIGILVLWAILIFYTIPYRIAVQRNAVNRRLIFFMNIFMGFTFFFWFVAFLWALLDEKEPYYDDEEIRQRRERQRREPTA